jgi:hypothetical protein
MAMGKSCILVVSLVLIAAGCTCRPDPPPYEEECCDGHLEKAEAKTCCHEFRCWNHQTGPHDCPHHACHEHHRCGDCAGSQDCDHYGCKGRYSENRTPCVCECHNASDVAREGHAPGWRCLTHGCYDHHCALKPPPCCASDRSTHESENAAREHHIAAAASSDLAEKRAHLEQAITIDPTRAVYFHDLALVYEALGDPARARFCFDEATRRNPKDPASGL